MKSGNFFAELKRRKVFKVGAAYLIVAWLAVQAASIGFPAFDAPSWALRIFILIAFLGFPIAVVMAWVFDITAEGVKLDPSVSGNKALFAVAVLLIVLALFWYFYGQPSFRKGDVATPTTAGHNSIAVLPFVNISGKADEDYFSDGMTEELLNVLAKIPNLNVVARTSVFEFKGKGGDVREIGRKLGVSNIVEGSVRRDREQVRVTAQLVRVADGFHIWSETYDRKLESVFALQDEIAQRIGAALKLSLGVSAPVAARAPIDPEAYDEYLKGRALLRQRSDLPSAIAHLKAAVAKAPEFAAAWSSLSLTYEVSFWFTAHMTPALAAEFLAGQRAAAERAAALEPDAAITEHALGNVARAQFTVRRRRTTLPARDADRPELLRRSRGLLGGALRGRSPGGFDARGAPVGDARPLLRHRLEPHPAFCDGARPACRGRGSSPADARHLPGQFYQQARVARLSSCVSTC